MARSVPPKQDREACRLVDASFKTERASFLGDLQSLYKQLQVKNETLEKLQMENDELRRVRRREGLAWRNARSALESETTTLRAARRECEELLAASTEHADKQRAELEELKVDARRLNKVFHEQLQAERREHKATLEEAASEKKSMSTQLEGLQVCLHKERRTWGQERGTYATAIAEATQRANLAETRAGELQKRMTALEERLAVALARKQDLALELQHQHEASMTMEANFRLACRELRRNVEDGAEREARMAESVALLQRDLEGTRSQLAAATKAAATSASAAATKIESLRRRVAEADGRAAEADSLALQAGEQVEALGSAISATLAGKGHLAGAAGASSDPPLSWERQRRASQPHASHEEEAQSSQAEEEDGETEESSDGEAVCPPASTAAGCAAAEALQGLVAVTAGVRGQVEQLVKTHEEVLRELAIARDRGAQQNLAAAALSPAHRGAAGLREQSSSGGGEVERCTPAGIPSASLLPSSRLALDSSPSSSPRHDVPQPQPRVGAGDSNTDGASFLNPSKAYVLQDLEQKLGAERRSRILEQQAVTSLLAQLGIPLPHPADRGDLRGSDNETNTDDDLEMDSAFHNEQRGAAGLPWAPLPTAVVREALAEASEVLQHRGQAFAANRGFPLGAAASGGDAAGPALHNNAGGSWKGQANGRHQDVETTACVTESEGRGGWGSNEASPLPPPPAGDNGSRDGGSSAYVDPYDVSGQHEAGFLELRAAAAAGGSGGAAVREAADAPDEARGLHVSEVFRALMDWAERSSAEPAASSSASPSTPLLPQLLLSLQREWTSLLRVAEGLEAEASRAKESEAAAAAEVSRLRATLQEEEQLRFPNAGGVDTATSPMPAEKRRSVDTFGGISALEARAADAERAAAGAQVELRALQVERDAAVARAAAAERSADAAASARDEEARFARAEADAARRELEEVKAAVAAAELRAAAAEERAAAAGKQAEAGVVAVQESRAAAETLRRQVEEVAATLREAQAAKEEQKRVAAAADEAAAVLRRQLENESSGDAVRRRELDAARDACREAARVLQQLRGCQSELLSAREEAAAAEARALEAEAFADEQAAAARETEAAALALQRQVDALPRDVMVAAAEARVQRQQVAEAARAATEREAMLVRDFRRREADLNAFMTSLAAEKERMLARVRDQADTIHQLTLTCTLGQSPSRRRERFCSNGGGGAFGSSGASSGGGSARIGGSSRGGNDADESLLEASALSLHAFSTLEQPPLARSGLGLAGGEASANSWAGRAAFEGQRGDGENVGVFADWKTVRA